jgi:flagellar biosynthetic protein FlhB
VSRTHEPTPRRLAQARERGEVARSSLLASWGALAGGALGVVAARAWAWPRAAGLLQEMWRRAPEAQTPGDILRALEDGAWALAWVAVPVALGGLLGASLGNAVQVGPRWTWGAPPAQDRARWTGGLTALVVLGVALWRAWSLLPAAHLSRATPHEPARLAALLWELSWGLVVPCLGAWAASSALAWLWERRLWREALLMTRQELEQDQREQQGSPETRQARANLRHEAASEEGDPWAHARLVVWGEAGGALLRWEEGEGRAPVVALRRARADLAELVLQAAQRGVGAVQDEAAARALCALPLGAPVPSPLQPAVAGWFAAHPKRSLQNGSNVPY